MRIRSGILTRGTNGPIFIRFDYTCLWTNLKGSYNIWHWQELERSTLTIIIHVVINQMQPVCLITAAFKAELRLWIDISSSLKVNELRAINCWTCWQRTSIWPVTKRLGNDLDYDESYFFQNPWICASTVHIQNHTN